MTKFEDNLSPHLTLVEQGSDPDTPATGTHKLFIDSADGHLKRIDEADAVTDVESAGIANHGYYQYLASLLEPDAIETLKSGTFSYVVGAGETKILTASWNTRLGSAGRMEIRNQRDHLFLRGVTLTGLVSGSCAVIIDPALPVYDNAQETYLDRMLEIATTKPQYLGIPAATTIPFLPGPYGAIVLHTTNYNSAWNSIRTNGDLYGWALIDEINDSSAFRMAASFLFAVNKRVACEFRNESGSDVGEARGSSLVYFLCPPAWGVIEDATVYLFRDDFWAASLDTSVKWNTPTQSTAGNYAIDTTYQWLKCVGNASWGNNGVHSQYNLARASGKQFICDVYTSLKTNSHTNNGLIVGWHDGAGDSYTDFAHGILFTSSGAAPIIKVYENGSDRGEVGSGITMGTVYRVRITLDFAGANSAKYEIQGGAYGALGSASWTDITPGTTSSSTTPLYVGAASALTNAFYISDVKVI